MVKKLEKEIQSLKRELAMHDTLVSNSNKDDNNVNKNLYESWN